MRYTNLQLKRYLLGNLDEKTDAEIGVQVISDETFEEKILVAENELMEDFLDKNLSPEEVKLFHENFLVCESREKQLEEIYFSKQFSKEHFNAKKSGEPKEIEKESFWRKFTTLHPSLRFAVPVLAVLLIAVLIGAYVISNRDGLSPLENEYVRLNQTDFSDLENGSQFSKIELISETYRSNDDLKKLKPENLSEKIFFRLAVLFNIPENDLLNAEVIKNQKTIFRQPNIRVYKNRNGQEFRLLLPREIFTKGLYRIKIENPKDENQPITYDFAVE